MKAMLHRQRAKGTEAALRDREHDLSQLVDMVPSHIWRLTTDGEPTFFNKRMVDFLGLDVADTDRPGMTRLAALIETVIHPDDATEYRSTLERCLRTGDHFSLRYRLRRADGVYRWMSSRAEPMRDQEGKVVHWYGLCHDIDDQVQAELARRLGEQRLRQMIDAMPALVWCATPDGTPIYVNKRFTEVTGAALDDILAPDGSPSLGFVHPDDKSWVRDTLLRSFEMGDPFVIRYRQLRNGGFYRWSETRAEAIRDSKGTLLQWYGVSVDIHDQVIAQETLYARERELSLFVDMIPGHLWRVAPNGQTILVNRHMADFVGHDLNDTTYAEIAFGDIIHPDDVEVTRDAFAGFLASGESFSMKYRLRRRDGVYRWMSGRAQPLRNANGRIVQWFGLSHDIDDQMRAEDAIRQSEQELHQMIDAVPARIWSLSSRGSPVYFNKRYQDYLRSVVANFDSLEEPHVDRLIQDLIYPDDAPGVAQTLKDCFETGRSAVMRFRTRENDGAFRWTECRVAPRRDQDGEVAQWYGVSTDIDDEMRANEALRKRERELSLLVDNAFDAFLSIDEGGHITEWNVQAEAMFGWRRQEALGRRLADLLIPARYRAEHEHGLNDFLTNEVGPWLNQRIEVSALRRDGDEFPVEVSIAPYRIGNSWAFNGFIRDISDRKLAEAKLAQATQAASLAVLSASIAHELNQPLAAIAANSHACWRWLSAEPPNVERAKITVQRMTRDASSAADVIGRIRELLRQTPRASPSENLRQLVDDALRSMTDEIAVQNVAVEVDIDPALPLVVLDRVQAQQVLANLIRNGIEAMESAPAGARTLRILSRRDAPDSVRIEICDAGTGLEDPKRVFEPFFTTKRHGTGMGLAICRSIIEGHGGRLWMGNNETRGATVAFTVPIAMGEAS